MFDDDGGITDVIELGDRNSGRNFFYRLSESRFHMPLSRTDMLVIHEVTNGPFDRDRTIFAPFAPAEDQIDEARKYMSEITAAVASIRRISEKNTGLPMSDDSAFLVVGATAWWRRNRACAGTRGHRVLATTRRQNTLGRQADFSRL
jgi:hypothetical protein